MNLKVLRCSVDNCDCEAAVDIWPEDDTRAWLCETHYAETRREDWVVFRVGGRQLMLSTSRDWFYLPEVDAGLTALAREAGLL